MTGQRRYVGVARVPGGPAAAPGGPAPAGPAPGGPAPGGPAPAGPAPGSPAPSPPVGPTRGGRRAWLRRGETVVWIAVAGVVALLAGFLLRAGPSAVPFLPGTPNAASPPAPDPSCVLTPCASAALTGPPTEVRITAIGVDSPLVDLALGRDGQLIAPQRYDRAGWYAKGVVPGDAGPAVIAGHVDSFRGPGVFFKLGTLRPGDLVEVLRGGQWLRFRVSAVESYPKDEFPTAKVYGPTPDAELRVITCGGDFDRVHGHYYDNVVVYAVLG